MGIFLVKWVVVGSSTRIQETAYSHPYTRVVVLGMLHTGHGSQAPQHKHQKHLQPGNTASVYRYNFRKW